MPKERACANSLALSRRTLLTALPASGVALSLPNDTHAATPSPIMALFREWEEIRRLSNLPETSDDDGEILTDRMLRVEDQMVDLPSESVSDLAAKIVAWTSWGDSGLPPRDNKLWIELQSLVGSRPRWMK